MFREHVPQVDVLDVWKNTLWCMDNCLW